MTPNNTFNCSIIFWIVSDRIMHFQLIFLRLFLLKLLNSIYHCVLLCLYSTLSRVVPLRRKSLDLCEDCFAFVVNYFGQFPYIIFIYKTSMLPSLKKINEKEFSATETKVYNPPSQLSHFQPKREHSYESSRNSGKPKYN